MIVLALGVAAYLFVGSLIAGAVGHVDDDDWHIVAAWAVLWPVFLTIVLGASVGAGIHDAKAIARKTRELREAKRSDAPPT